MPASNKDRLSIDVESGAILAALARAVGLIDDPQAMLTDIGAHLEEKIFYRITTSKSDPTGKQWQPLAESTKKTYKSQDRDKSTGKVVTSGSLLRRTGLMLQSAGYVVDANSVTVGFSIKNNDAPYAIFHITGTSRMPRRDSLFASIAASASSGTLGPQDEADIIEIVEDHVRKALGDAAG